VTRQVIIVGGGMGGLAAALACSRAGWDARLYEQAAQFSEVGAGIQLGPNATRILDDWGLDGALSAVAAFPQCLRVRSALDGAQLGLLRLGSAFTARYGAPYATVHRADLQGLLVDAARQAGAYLKLSARVTAVLPSSDAVGLRIGEDREVEGDALVGADGLWSRHGPDMSLTGQSPRSGICPSPCAARMSRSGSGRACTWWPIRSSAARR
jgi:salicylate hydroxylase